MTIAKIMNSTKKILTNPIPILSGLIKGIMRYKGGPSWIRTNEGARPADLQSAPVDRFGIDPFSNYLKLAFSLS